VLHRALHHHLPLLSIIVGLGVRSENGASTQDNTDGGQC